MKTVLSDWYRLEEISRDVFWVNEPGHVSFYIFRSGDSGLFIDSGLGLSVDLKDELLRHLGIRQFDVLSTHAHCDHVGLNEFAANILIAKNEWEKFVARNESSQLQHYIDALTSSKQWPRDFDYTARSSKWSPNRFVSDGELVEFGQWVFEIISVPGHTCGGQMFFESKTKMLFSGDLIYTGAHYLHLKDSSLRAFKKSIDRLCALQEVTPGMSIWPAHNQIPLPLDYPSKVQDFARKADFKFSQLTKSWPKDGLFEDGILLKTNDVTLVVRKDDEDV